MADQVFTVNSFTPKVDEAEHIIDEHRHSQNMSYQEDQDLIIMYINALKSVTNIEVGSTSQIYMLARTKNGL